MTVLIKFVSILLISLSVSGCYYYLIHRDMRYMIGNILMGVCGCVALASNTWYPLLVAFIGLHTIQHQINSGNWKMKKKSFIDLRRYPALITSVIWFLVLLIYTPAIIYAYKRDTLSFLIIAIYGTCVLFFLIMIRFMLSDRRNIDILIFRNFREKTSPTEQNNLSGMEWTFDFVTFHLIPLLKCFGETTGLANPRSFIRKGPIGKYWDLLLNKKNWGVRYGDNWKEVAAELLSTCKLAVFFLTEKSESILLELQMAVKRIGREKIVLILPQAHLSKEIARVLNSDNIIPYEPSEMHSTLLPLSQIAVRNLGAVNFLTEKCIKSILTGHSPLSLKYQGLSILSEIVPSVKTITKIPNVFINHRNCEKCNSPAHYKCKKCSADWCFKCQEENGYYFIRGRCGKCNGPTTYY